MSDSIQIPVPIVAPLGWEVTAEDVQCVWDTYIKPGQDAGTPQSIEELVLMAILRSIYASLSEEEVTDV